MKPTEENTNDAPNPTYRSRFGRFSPAMGWKAFWSEIVIVILGVLIALAANQAAEEWSWQNKVREGEARLRDNAMEMYAYAAENLVVYPCVQAQLNALSDIVLKSGDRLQPLPTHSDKFTESFVVRYPTRRFSFVAWESLQADGTVSRLSKARYFSYMGLNGGINSLQKSANDSAITLGRLEVMALPIPLDAGVRNNLLTSIAEQKIRLKAMNVDAVQLMVAIHEMKLQPRPQEVEAFLQPSRTAGTMKFCEEQGLPLSDWQTILKDNPYLN